MLNQAMKDRYRCPDAFLDFRLAGELIQKAGYFKFGSSTTCYGRTSNGVPQANPSPELHDALPSVTLDREQVVLPFDPDEVIDNLRLERYPSGQFSRAEKALKEIYYWLRPLTSRSLRGRVQKFRAANWQQTQFPQWPVDTTVESLCESLLLLTLKAKQTSHIPFVWFWPDGAHGCIAMTHDVETVAGRDFCGQLLDLDHSFGIKASFQIVPEERYPVPPEFLKQIEDRGFEVGVQDLNHDGRLFDDHDEFRRRAAIINRYGREYGARGFRAAVLYRKPDWYSDLDFSYDMSIPNVAHLDPQRGGCCTVMPYFIGNILELPLTTIQDYTLFQLLNERTIDLWKGQLEMILARHGLATFIVHPDYITEPQTLAVYEALLGWLVELRKKERLWFALPRDIDSWWRARHRMSVVQDGDSWRIVGEGSKRATLAFATLVDDQLVYEFAGASQPAQPVCPNVASAKALRAYKS
jgi:hypothetical protein